MSVFAIGFCGRSTTEGYCAGVNWPQKDRLWTYWGPLFDMATRAVVCKEHLRFEKNIKLAYNVTRCGEAMNGAWRDCQHLPIKLNVCSVF
jgi:hypothetical protein